MIGGKKLNYWIRQWRARRYSVVDYSATAIAVEPKAIPG